MRINYYHEEVEALKNWVYLMMNLLSEPFLTVLSQSFQPLAMKQIIRLADFVSDKRVETPSAAAKSLGYSALSYRNKLIRRLQSIGQSLSDQLHFEKKHCKQTCKMDTDWANHYEKTALKLKELTHRLTQANCF